MSQIREWSTTAASNNSAAPDGWPEGMPPSGVNDAGREMMAAIKTWYLQSFTHHISGLTISNNGIDALNDIDVAVGAAMDTTGVEIMEQTTAGLTKRIDATWAVGDGQGGREPGHTLVANALMGVWLIADVTNNVVDVMISPGFTVAGIVFPTNYTIGQLIGCIKLDGSKDILGFTQVGDYFLYDAHQTDVNGAAIANDTAVTATVSAPPNSVAVGSVSLSNTSETSEAATVWVWNTGQTEPTSVAESIARAHYDTSVNFRGVASEFEVLVDGSSQLKYKGTEATDGATMSLTTKAFWMLGRGKAT